MTDRAAFRATYADWKLVKTRGVVQVIFEVPLADHDVAYQVVGGMPDPARERWFGIAALQAPIPQAEKENDVSAAATPRRLPSPATGAKRPWEELQPAQQAGIRANDIRFAMFLEEEYSREWREHQDAADCIRSICSVHSRTELGTDQKKRVLWVQLDKHFQAWDAKVRLNA